MEAQSQLFIKVKNLKAGIVSISVAACRRKETKPCYLSCWSGGLPHTEGDSHVTGREETQWRGRLHAQRSRVPALHSITFLVRWELWP